MATVRRRAERRFAYLFVLPALALSSSSASFPLLWGFCSRSPTITAFPTPTLSASPTMSRSPTTRPSAAIVNTLILLATLPIWIVLPLLLAILIHQGVPGGKLFRGVYFFPAVLSSVIIGSIFNVVLRYDGTLNAMLKAIGLDAGRLARRRRRPRLAA